MKKSDFIRKDSWTFGLSIVAIALSIMAILLYCIKVYPLTFEDVSIIIPVMAGVVTIYMVIRIFDGIYLEKRIRESISSDMERRADDILFHGMYLAFFFQGVNELNKTHSEAALFYLFRSMECLEKTSIDRDKMDEIAMKIKKAITDYPPSLTSADIGYYIKIAASSGSKECDKIISSLMKMQTNDNM